mmetsp:Transcript_26442/g.55149  ORF Transcript_26442/g.55149 Transcript_26442/m.55149 type:complete len:201 (+) Transcript_26442:1158-1760(+)
MSRSLHRNVVVIVKVDSGSLLDFLLEESLLRAFVRTHISVESAFVAAGSISASIPSSSCTTTITRAAAVSSSVTEATASSSVVDAVPTRVRGGRTSASTFVLTASEVTASASATAISTSSPAAAVTSSASSPAVTATAGTSVASSRGAGWAAASVVAVVVVGSATGLISQVRRNIFATILHHTSKKNQTKNSFSRKVSIV